MMDRLFSFQLLIESNVIRKEKDQLISFGINCILCLRKEDLVFTLVNFKICNFGLEMMKEIISL